MLPLLNMQQTVPPPPEHAAVAAHGGGSKLKTAVKKPAPAQQQQQMMRTVSISILVMSLPVLYVSFLHVPPAALFRDTTFWFLMSNSIILVIAADSGMLFFRSSSPSAVENDDGLPFVVAGDDPAAKTGHVVADEVVVLPVAVAENHQVMVPREEQEEAVTAVVAAGHDHDAYALVLRDDHGARRVASEPVVLESRDIMVVTPPSSGFAAGGAMVRANAPRPSLASSRSAAREQRLRRRHSHRQSHSRALVPVQEKQQLRRTATEGRPSEEKDMSEYARLSDEELNQRVEEFIAKFNMEMRLQLQREQQLALAAA